MISRRCIDPVARRSEILSGTLLNEILGFNYCPVCGNTASFDVYSDRKKALCKNCNSLERHRTVFALIQETFTTCNDTSVLYIGEDYITSTYLSNQYNADTIKVDRSTDSSEIAIPSKKYDLVVLGDIVGHVPDLAAFLDKVKDCVAKKGFLFMYSVLEEDNTVREVPSDNPLVYYKDAVRTYSEETCISEISKVFDVEVATVKKCFSEGQVKLFSIRNRYNYYICKVQ
ncbi:MAG: class I SAM-dependent methyltransferase [archaeon]|nr:class I SAM-dependent methyltransferase [archaeon]